MSRSARIKSISGIYHVMLRGMDRRIIFADDHDRSTFIRIMKKVKEKSNYKLYAFCLMDNHVHMLIEEGDEPLDMIFKRIGVSYVSYYNRKYDLYGHLFQDRFRSESVDSERYFLDLIRYICQNPIKAGLCVRPQDYPWLECKDIRNDIGIVDGISEYTSLCGEDLAAFVREKCDCEHLEYSVAARLTDGDAIVILRRVTGCSAPQEISRIAGNERKRLLRACLNAGLSVRQIARITGVSKYAVEHAKN